MELIIGLMGLGITFYLLAVLCDDYFVGALDEIALKLKMNSEVAGATLMAVGSSAPELFTAVIAIFSTDADMADVGAGTIVGSAIFNILVIIGISASFRAAILTWQPVLRDLLFYCLSIIAMLLFFWDSQIVWWEALSLVIAYGFYVIAVLKWNVWFNYEVPMGDEFIEIADKRPTLAHAIFNTIMNIPKKKSWHYIWVFFMSILLIGILSYLMVESALLVSSFLNIHPAIIALTVLAAGTSVPDLISSVVVAKQGRGDMAVSNAVGSNIFNIFIGLGLPWLVAIMFMGRTSIPVGAENLLSSVFLLFATVIAVLFILILRRWRISKRAGLALVAVYVLYVIYNVAQVV